jgi:hypothetical protein
MAQELENRSDRLFAHESDFAFLLDRAGTTGLTAIVAGPQMGKSWTLTELARRLATRNPDPVLVGYAEATGTTPDLLLRAVADLYRRWLDESTALAQFQQMWRQQKDNLLPGVIRALGKLAGEVPVIGKLIGGAADQALGGLLAANADLKTGGLSLQPLQYEQARDLVRTVAELSKRKIALFLDAWEHSSDPRAAAEPLGAFAVKAETWPPCHIYLTSRPDPAALGPLQDIVDSVAGTALIHPLSDFAPDPAEAARLTEYLQAQVPATQPEDTKTLLRLIDGCPGVIGRWTSRSQSQTMRDGGDLARIALDAQAYRFGDLEAVLETLDGDKRLLALRLAILPNTASRNGWAALRQTALDEGGGKALDETLLDDLLDLDVLEATDPPHYGHAKRLDTAIAWFRARRPTLLRQQVALLARLLGAKIDSVERLGEAGSAVTSLRDLAAVASLDRADPWPAALCTAATTLFGQTVPVEALELRDWILRPDTDLTGARLVAMGLVNAIYFAGQTQDTAGADGFLEILGRLAARVPGDAVVASNFAGGLTRRYDTATLRGLAAKVPAEPMVRVALARRLFIDLDEAREAGNIASATAALAELRTLVAGHPTEAPLRIRFCQGLYNLLRAADEAGDPGRAAALLAEITRQAEAFPEDAEVAECLARGLYQLCAVTRAEMNAAERAERLGRLQGVVGRFPGNAFLGRILGAAVRRVEAIGVGKVGAGGVPER